MDIYEEIKLAVRALNESGYSESSELLENATYGTTAAENMYLTRSAIGEIKAVIPRESDILPQLELVDMEAKRIIESIR